VDNVKDDLHEWTIVSALSPDYPKSFNIPVHIQEEIPLSAFIDSGAMGNFIHPHVITAHQIPTMKRACPLHLQTVTGKTFHIVTHQVQTQMTTCHRHKETIMLDMAPVRKHKILLRLPWCKLHKVQFDWNNHDILQWGPECKEHFPTHISNIMLGHTAQKELLPEMERHTEL